jgi:hypothetical protein
LTNALNFLYATFVAKLCPKPNMTKVFIILIRMAIKNCIALQLNVIDDFQATNRKQEEYKKHHHKQVDALTFVWKNHLKQHFFDKKP